jgi:prophage DNA circulation protein
MSILSGFYKASYSIGGKTALFYARSASDDGLGRKTVIHEYPNSSERYVQDLGKKSGIYDFEIEIQETTSSRYKRSKKKLEDNLNTIGRGTLTHPTIGKKNVVVVSASVDEDFINELGIAKYRVTFAESTLNKYPEEGSSKSALSKWFDQNFASAIAAFNQAVEYYDRGIEAFNIARDYIQNATQTVNDIVSTINGVADEAAAIVADIADLTASLTELMQTPANLSRRFESIFGAISQITDNFSTMVDIALNIFDSMQDGQYPASSATNEQLNANNQELNNYFKTSSLSIACLASTNIDYTSQEEIDKMIQKLNNAFDSLDPDKINEDVYYNLQNLKVGTGTFLRNLQTTLPFYVSLQTNSIPSAILSYNYYGTSDRSDEILLLNNIEDPSFVAGQINILSE